MRLQELLNTVAAEVLRRLAGSTAAAFSRQHLSNTMWALATLEHDPGRPFLAAVAAAMTQRAGECNPQEISNSVWAFARLSTFLAPPFLDKLC